MRSFFVQAILGFVAVQAVTVGNMARLEKKMGRKKIKEGQSIFVRCDPFNKNFDFDTHRRATVSIDGL